MKLVVSWNLRKMSRSVSLNWLSALGSSLLFRLLILMQKSWYWYFKRIYFECSELFLFFFGQLFVISIAIESLTRHCIILKSFYIFCESTDSEFFFQNQHIWCLDRGQSFLYWGQQFISRTTDKRLQRTPSISLLQRGRHFKL